MAWAYETNIKGPPGANGSPDTAAQVLAKLVTVDGAGSGLDADVVDGKHAADLVLKAGDTMTGDLTITKASPYLKLNRTGRTAGTWNVVAGNAAGVTEWDMALGQETSGGFALSFYNNAGAFAGAALYGERANGLLSVWDDPVDPYGIATKRYVDAHAVIGGTITIGSTPPPSPGINDVWIDTT